MTFARTVFSSASSPGPQQRAIGRVTLLIGCMFSGKTTTMLRILAAAPPRAVLGVKHARDVRHIGDHIISHAGLCLKATVVVGSDELVGLPVDGVRIVGIDEAHFFDDGLVDAVQSLSLRGIDVILTGLDRTSWGRPFPLIRRLGAVADEICILTATCARCGGVGEFTQRLTPVVNGQIVGGVGAFEPRCAQCWTPPPEPPVD